MTPAVLQGLQAAVGVVLVVYAAATMLRSVNWARLWSLWPSARPAVPADDLRIVIDMAARLRDAGNLEAVRVCQALIDELLKPQKQ